MPWADRTFRRKPRPKPKHPGFKKWSPETEQKPKRPHINHSEDLVLVMFLQPHPILMDRYRCPITREFEISSCGPFERYDRIKLSARAAAILKLHGIVKIKRGVEIR